MISSKRLTKLTAVNHQLQPPTVPILIICHISTDQSPLIITITIILLLLQVHDKASYT